MILLLMLAAVAPDCYPLGHDRILGSDLAAASAVFVAMPPDVVIANAPRPGARRLFEPAELLRIAHASNLAVANVATLCFERSAEPLDPELVKAAMRKSLGDPLVAIEVVTMSKYPTPQGDLTFPRDSLIQPTSADSAIWNGYVSYDGGRFPVWAQVRLIMHQARVVSLVELLPKHIVEPGDLKIEEADEFPRRVAPLTTIEAAAGLVARRALPAGAVLTAAMLEPPYDIERGQTVTVEVHSGGAIVKMEAKAESAGRRGDTVSVRNATSGVVFRAQVEGKGRVVVKCPSLSEVSQ